MTITKKGTAAYPRYTSLKGTDTNLRPTIEARSRNKCLSPSGRRDSCFVAKATSQSSIRPQSPFSSMLAAGLILILTSGSGCSITLLSMMPESYAYERTIAAVGMMMDFGIGYAIADADEDVTSEEVFINGLMYGGGIFLIDYLLYNSIWADFYDALEEEDIADRNWRKYCEINPTEVDARGLLRQSAAPVTWDCAYTTAIH